MFISRFMTNIFLWREIRGCAQPLTEFLLQQGQGRVYTEGREGGIVNCREIKEQRSQRAYNTAAKAEKYWVGAVILKGEVSKIQNG